MKLSGQQTLGALAHVTGDVGWRKMKNCNANGSRLCNFWIVAVASQWQSYAESGKGLFRSGCDIKKLAISCLFHEHWAVN